MPGTLSTAICSGLPVPRAKMHPPAMGTKSRETIYGASVRAAAERAREARKQADRLACEAWNKRMLAFKGPAQPSPVLGEALNAGYLLRSEMPRLRQAQTVALDIVRRPNMRGGTPLAMVPTGSSHREGAREPSRSMFGRHRSNGQKKLIESRP